MENIHEFKENIFVPHEECPRIELIRKLMKDVKTVAVTNKSIIEEQYAENQPAPFEKKVQPKIPLSSMFTQLAALKEEKTQIFTVEPILYTTLHSFYVKMIQRAWRHSKMINILRSMT